MSTPSMKIRTMSLFSPGTSLIQNLIVMGRVSVKHYTSISSITNLATSYPSVLVLLSKGVS